MATDKNKEARTLAKLIGKDYYVISEGVSRKVICADRFVPPARDRSHMRQIDFIAFWKTEQRKKNEA
jgi:hypothetical protein